MILLPIVERELRVAARKRSTFWVRIGAAALALLIGAGVLLLMTLPGSGLASMNMGGALFSLLTWLSLAAALSAGLFLTSDCLSEEKREGTIGFLFLTDLRGWHIALGKLLATSLRSFYAQSAVLPILALTLVMGGVTGTQFWKTSLALISALELSLVAGLCISSMSRDSQKALTGTTLLVLFLVGGGPLFDTTLAWLEGTSFKASLSLTSPGFLFVSAGAGGSLPFWSAVLANQVVGLSLFGLSAVLLPRTWQTGAPKRKDPSVRRLARWRSKTESSRFAFRAPLLAVQPVEWLLCRARWQAFPFWCVTGLLVAGLVAIYIFESQPTALGIWSFLSGFFSFVLYLGVASYAVRFFCDARKSGLLELLLTTPLTGLDIVQGQWRGLLRQFGIPLVIAMSAYTINTYIAQREQLRTWGQMSAAMSSLAASTVATNSGGVVITSTRRLNVSFPPTPSTGSTTGSASSASPKDGVRRLLAAALLTAASAAVVLTHVAALIWFGMWMGLTSRTGNLAALKTIVFVQVIPTLAITFCSALLLPILMLSRIVSPSGSASASLFLWYPILGAGLSTALALAKDAVFIAWARRRLHADWRAMASQSNPAAGPPTPPRLPIHVHSPV